MKRVTHSADSVVSLAYAAGIIDGEGYVGIKRSKGYKCQGCISPKYHARITVRMVERGPLDVLALMFGGVVRAEKPQLPMRRNLWQWAVSDKKAEDALGVLLPLLIVKRNPAKTVLCLRRLQGRGYRYRTKPGASRRLTDCWGRTRTVRSWAYSDEYVAWCHRLYMKCRGFNGGALRLAQEAMAA